MSGRGLVDGHTILNIVRVQRPSLLEFRELPSRPERWKYMTRVASVLEHNERQTEAFAWYLKALEDTEGQRSGTSDHNSRVGMRSTTWTRYLYDGLIRLCLDFEACGTKSSTSDKWGLLRHRGRTRRWHFSSKALLVR